MERITVQEYMDKVDLVYEKDSFSITESRMDFDVLDMGIELKNFFIKLKDYGVIKEEVVIEYEAME